MVWGVVMDASRRGGIGSFDWGVMSELLGEVSERVSRMDEQGRKEIVRKMRRDLGHIVRGCNGSRLLCVWECVCRGKGLLGSILSAEEDVLDELMGSCRYGPIAEGLTIGLMDVSSRLIRDRYSSGSGRQVRGDLTDEGLFWFGWYDRIFSMCGLDIEAELERSETQEGRKCDANI